MGINWAKGEKQIVTQKKGAEYDSRDKLEVVNDLRKMGEHAVPMVSPNIILFNYMERVKARAYDFTPLSGVPNSKTVFCNESGNYSIYKSDRYGFNNDDKAYEKNIQILMLGDSYTQGACVQEGEDVASRLRGWGYNTISTGMAGSGPLLELATLREYGAHLRPKIILLLYYGGNDLENLIMEYNQPLLKKYLDPNFSQNLFYRQPEINEFLSNFLSSHEKAYFLVTLKNYITLYNLRSFFKISGYTRHEEPSSILPHFRDVLEKILQESEKLGAQLFFIHLAELDDLTENSNPRKRKEVLSIVKGLQIPIVDFLKDLKQEKAPSKYAPFKNASHYNAQGYERLARLILDQALQDNPRLNDGNLQKK